MDYGVARPGRKRLAVPFRAADTPAERAEFSQPDVASALTMVLSRPAPRRMPCTLIPIPRMGLWL